MKTFIWTVLLIIIIGVGYLLYTSAKQNKEIESLPEAEVSESMEKASGQEATADQTIILTKTSSGIQQSGDSSVEIDPENTYLRFTGYKVGGEHVGSFDAMKAEVYLEEGTITGGKLTIDATSVKTDTDKVDEHLQTADFFDTALYPEISFETTGLLFDDINQSAIMKGNLTIHGVTKEISAPITILANGMATDFTISLKQFGIEFPVVKDEVRIESQIVLK